MDKNNRKLKMLYKIINAYQCHIWQHMLHIPPTKKRGAVCQWAWFNDQGVDRGTNLALKTSYVSVGVV